MPIRYSQSEGSTTALDDERGELKINLPARRTAQARLDRDRAFESDLFLLAIGRLERVTSRFRSISFYLGLLLLFGSGCDDAQFAGPIPYRPSERAAKDLADKPKLQEAVQKTLVSLYGPDVRHIKVPENSGLRDGGIYLADHYKVGDQVEPTLERDPVSGKSVAAEGGYALYRKHCLQCHGVFGAGDGPTSTFLVPRPRDYRPGIFKFTSTNPTNAKPSRADLRKTLLYGLHGTSMPGFEATMTLSADRSGHRLHDLPLDPRRDRAAPDRRGHERLRESDAETALAEDVPRRSSRKSPCRGKKPRHRLSTLPPAACEPDPGEHPPRSRPTSWA